LRNPLFALTNHEDDCVSANPGLLVHNVTLGLEGFQAERIRSRLSRNAMPTVPPQPATRKWWHVPIELRVLFPLLIIVGGTFLFLLLGDAVSEGTTQEFDEKIVRLVRDPNDPSKIRGPKWAMEIARDITALGGYFVLTLVTVAVCGFLALIGKQIALRIILISVLGGWIGGMGLKALFERQRPDVVEHLSHVQSSSFPSGHSMMSAVVYLTLGALLDRFFAGRWLRLYILGLAILLSFLVGCSRILMGVHYPTDVLAGWTAGLVWATLCYLLTRRWQHRHPQQSDAPEPSEETPS